MFEGRKWWMRENRGCDEPETHLEVATTLQIRTWDHLREERQSGVGYIFQSFQRTRKPKS